MLLRIHPSVNLWLLNCYSFSMRISNQESLNLKLGKLVIEFFIIDWLTHLPGCSNSSLWRIFHEIDLHSHHVPDESEGSQMPLPWWMVIRQYIILIDPFKERFIYISVRWLHLVLIYVVPRSCLTGIRFNSAGNLQLVRAGNIISIHLTFRLNDFLRFIRCTATHIYIFISNFIILLRV
jgi:hypothetical protein